MTVQTTPHMYGYEGLNTPPRTSPPQVANTAPRPPSSSPSAAHRGHTERSRAPSQPKPGAPPPRAGHHRTAASAVQSLSFHSVQNEQSGREPRPATGQHTTKGPSTSCGAQHERSRWETPAAAGGHTAVGGHTTDPRAAANDAQPPHRHPAAASEHTTIGGHTTHQRPAANGAQPPTGSHLLQRAERVERVGKRRPAAGGCTHHQPADAERPRPPPGPAPPRSA